MGKWTFTTCHTTCKSHFFRWVVDLWKKEFLQKPGVGNDFLNQNRSSEKRGKKGKLNYFSIGSSVH